MSTEQPNVLWIYGEDLSPDLGCYGTPAVATPNIDRLASEGVRYTNAFVTCPVCSLQQRRRRLEHENFQITDRETYPQGKIKK